MSDCRSLAPVSVDLPAPEEPCYQNLIRRGNKKKQPTYVTSAFLCENPTELLRPVPHRESVLTENCK